MRISPQTSREVGVRVLFESEIIRYLTPPAGAGVCVLDSPSSVCGLAAIDCALISARYSDEERD
jgi:hypothetical protein